MAAILGPVPNMTPPPPPGGMGAPSQAGMSTGPNGMPAGRLAQPESKTEKLGTQTIEGVSAEGTRQTTTLPAGLTGGNGPAVTVSETWFSPELKVTMLSKENDPRLGERTTKLVNVNRSEPSATLFAPAADYKVVEERPEAMIQPGQRK